MWGRYNAAFSLALAATVVLLVLCFPDLERGVGVRYPSVRAAEQSRPAFQTIDSARLNKMLQRKDFLLVNVHVPYEGQIGGTDAFIPFDKIDQSLEKLPRDKNAKIVLYCRSGRMSEIAATRLSELGYTRVSHLSGGMIAWKGAGYALQEQ